MSFFDEIDKLLEFLRTSSKLQQDFEGGFVGCKVKKKSGFSFSGTVVSYFFTLDGKPRFVVESTVTGAEGLLFIFNPEQLERV